MIYTGWACPGRTRELPDRARELSLCSRSPTLPIPEHRSIDECLPRHDELCTDRIYIFLCIYIYIYIYIFESGRPHSRTPYIYTYRRKTYVKRQHPTFRNKRLTPLTRPPTWPSSASVVGAAALRLGLGSAELCWLGGQGIYIYLNPTTHPHPPQKTKIGPRPHQSETGRNRFCRT